MDPNQISYSPGLPPLSGQHVWLVSQMLEAEDMLGDQVFYNIHEPQSSYRCRVPELLGRRIRGCFHGWVIMSNHPHNNMWSLWNPSSSSKPTRLPTLNHEDISECCLPSPPDAPGSILLLTRKEKPTFVFCRLDRKRKRLRWTEMSYAKQLKNITGEDGFVHGLTCCNGKVYALNAGHDRDGLVVEVDIVVTAKEVAISVLPFVKLPRYSPVVQGRDYYTGPFLKGSCSEVFIIYQYFKLEEVSCMRLVRLDMTRKLWEEIEDFEGATCFLDLDCSSNAIVSMSSGGHGGCIHMICEEEKVIYSYHVKDKTMARSSMPYFQELWSRTSYVSLWAMPECSLEGFDSKEEEEDDDHTVEVNSLTNQSHLFNIPFHLLEMIMEFCGDIDYVNFRATFKQLTAPVTRWGNGSSMRRLQRYSLVSPWLMVLDNDHGIITFIDPMFGDRYSIRTPPELNGNDLKILSSMYGWLLMSKDRESLMFFNPFTSEIRELPNLEEVDFIQSFCFSAPPTSPNCVVFGLGDLDVFIHFVAHEPATWVRYDMHFNGGGVPAIFSFSIYCNEEDLYALNKEGELSVFKYINEENYFRVTVDITPPSCCRLYFLVKHDQDILLVILDDKFGESVELYKLSRRHRRRRDKKWEKIDGLGKHMIFICETSCLCMEARTPEMENKIYFAMLDGENGKIVFYSFDTCRYHTFNAGKNIGESFRNLFGSKLHLHPHVWIQPTY
ncbi:hypothetical protein E3N88_24442 [Mikania micrantha]|uniref:KIB1-4 beta-propeller domain-containing protein n=1 Tax=Mikania micrantha TaxID=192012 RepID=A0A5N6N276_9ASTR|nr:hypothetical protein E3N88_24442 [Mikania micrantha]